MKRLLRWVFSLSALLSLCALGWLLLSPAAPPLLWRTLHWLLPGELQVAQSEGALLGTLQLRDIDYRLAQRHVSLRRLSWTLSRPALLRGELRFDALSLDGLHVDWPTAGSSSGFTPPTLSLPLPIELRHAQLTDLRIGDSTPEPLTLDRVTLVARAFAGQITLTLLEVERTPWRARLSGTLDLQRAAAMQLQGTLHGQWRDEPVTVDASLRGQFDELLAFSLDSTHPAQWRIAGTAQPATDRFDWQAQLELIALPGRLIGQPALALSGTAQLQGEGARTTAELAMALSGLPLGPVQLQARTRLDDDLLDIDSGRLHWGAGASVVTLRGRIADLWNDSRHLDLHGDWLDLGWPVAAPRLHSPAGQLHLTGDLDHYQATLSARLQAEPIGDSHWQLQLQGTPQRIELTRFGGELLQGQIDAQGSLDLAGRQFSMQSQLQRLDLSPLLQRKVIGSGLLTLSGHYGESLAELRLRLSDGLLDHGAAQHQLLIDAGWQPGAWQLDRLQLRGASSQLSARGRLGEQIDLDLSAHFADLGLWLADGAGTLSLQGKVQGHRQSPRIEFEGQGQRLRWRTWSAQQAETRLRLDLDPAAESRITLQADTLTGLGQPWPRLTLFSAARAEQADQRHRGGQHERSGLRDRADGSRLHRAKGCWSCEVRQAGGAWTRTGSGPWGSTAPRSTPRGVVGSATAEPRLPFLGERGQRLAAIFAHEHLVVAHLLELEAEGEAHVEGAVDGLEGRRLGHGRPFGHGVDEGDGVVDHGDTFGGDAVHEPPREGLGRTEAPPEEDHLFGARLADHAGETLRTTRPRDDAEGGLRQGELGVRRTHTQVAHQRELEPTSERDAVDRRDDGLRRRIEHAELAAVKLDLRAHVVLGHALTLLEVGPRAEGLVAGAGDHDRAHRRVGDRLARELSERAQRGA